MVQTTTERVKVSFNLTPQEVERLKDLASKRGVTATDVLRRALATEFYIYDTYAEGGKLLIEEPGKPTRELVLL